MSCYFAKTSWYIIMQELMNSGTIVSQEIHLQQGQPQVSRRSIVDHNTIWNLKFKVHTHMCQNHKFDLVCNKLSSWPHWLFCVGAVYLNFALQLATLLESWCMTGGADCGSRLRLQETGACSRVWPQGSEGNWKKCLLHCWRSPLELN